MKWVGVVAALSALVGYGIWIGTIQNSIQTLKEDVDENEDLIKANAKMLAKAETVERDRFQKLLDAVQVEFRNDKDELWELKQAVALIRMEVRYRAGERAATINMTPEAPINPEPPGLATGGGGGSGSGFGRGVGSLRPVKGDMVYTTDYDEEVEEATPPPAKSPSRHPRRPTRSEIAEVAEQADEAVEEMAEDEPRTSPLHKLTF